MILLSYAIAAALAYLIAGILVSAAILHHEGSYVPDEAEFAALIALFWPIIGTALLLVGLFRLVGLVAITIADRLDRKAATRDR